MPYEKIKRNKVDRCNICSLTKSLSWDHVPPQGGIVLSSVEIKNIFLLLAGRQNNQFRISQNGVKYRTICSGCNSKIGRDFDPTLNEFNNALTKYIQSNLILPQILYIKTKPLRLIKAVLAHLIAAKLNIDKVKIDETVRQIIFDDNALIPDNINIFYWIYPYDTTIIMRDFSLASIAGDYSSFSFCHLIKYFPIAFIITDKNEFRGLASLTKFKSCGIDEEIELRIDLKQIKDYDWPEKVDDTNIVFMSAETQNGIIAKPK